MGDAKLLVISNSKENIKKATERVDYKLQKKGCKDDGPVSYPAAPFSEMRRIVNNFGDVEKDKLEWLKEINTTSSDYISDCGAKTVYGSGFLIQTRLGVDADSIIEEIETPDGTTIQRVRKSSDTANHTAKQGQTPFSYDPAQDYYTEPDKY